MNYHRPRQGSPGKRLILLLPAAVLAIVAGLSTLLVFNLTARSEPPAVLADAASRAALAPGSSPFALSALHRRLPPYALEQVGRYIDYFQRTRRRGLEGAIARSTKYLQGFKRIFHEYGLPDELAYLPLIESGFMENAVSPAQAAGVWQFTRETGRRFNLQSNSWFDRRFDPMRSARAAALYLKQLYREFKDWDLALAAYNSGSGTVRWARRVNRKAKRPRHYWALEELPDETRNYVPRFIAAVLIAKNLDAFGFNKIRFMPRVVFERIKVTPGFSLAVLAKHLDINAQSLFELNPELIQQEIPPGNSLYLLRIPPGTRKLVRAKLAGRVSTPGKWLLHQVAVSDTVLTLASRFQAKPDRIMRVNGLRDGQELAGRKFVIIPL
ncbi:MAG: lytic transglycosylase domain-containing protein [SAR324 cluster bacterium]|nr:lytic transglycosylase domain-containing protein [SAR324 cluster bacterium]